MRHPISRISSAAIRMAIAALLAWGTIPGVAAEPEAPADRSEVHDHGRHQMDHSAQGGDHADHAEGDDPHAHHRAVMQQSGYRRSQHEYSLDDRKLVRMDGEANTLLKVLDSGRPVMLNFIFTSCTTICPVMSATFAQVQSELGPDAGKLHMVSISIDPEHDTPRRLHDYAKRFNAGPQWDFYTGGLNDMIAIQKDFDVYRGNKMSHEPTTLMRKSVADPWVRIDGLASVKDIVKEYRQLIGQ